jgi:hypothetical protein
VLRDLRRAGGHRHQDHGNQQQRGRDHVDVVGPNMYSRPPSTGPAITATWKVEDCERDGLAEVLVRHQVAQHGLRGRHHEGARAAEQHQHREHRPDQRGCRWR